ncbi:MAG TPA: tetratricopeptide repeat protein, partial [Gammaproteobacteria bacterium]
ERAIEHAKVAVSQDPDYSAAWRLLGQAQVAAGQHEAAAESFERGIAVARQRGDRQVEKEMQVFLRRLRNDDQERD